MKNVRTSAIQPIPRRDFIRGALMASTFPFFARATRGNDAAAGGSASASGKVNLACCGIGNRGGAIVEELAKTGLANIVALCDTDMGAPHTQAILKKYPNVPRFQDFRVMLDKMGKDIDALSVGVPDHTHFPICMHAMALGKHVYVEKPMAHTFREIALMMQAEKKFKVAAQMGNQGHSEGNYFQFKAFVEAGLLKNVRKVVGHMNGVRRWHKWNGQVPGLPAGQPVPEGLDWDTWIGHKPFVDYHRDYVQGDWRCWYQFGNGALGDWGAHILDTAHEFLQLGLPNAVSAVKIEGHNPYVFPMASTLQFKFPARGPDRPACDVFWYDGQKNFPTLPPDYGQAVVADDVPPPGAGSTATAAMPPGKEIYTDDLVFKGGSHGTSLAIIPEAKAKDMAGQLPKVPKSPSNHFKNFLRACQGEETCRSSFAVAGPLCQMMALGIIAQRLNASFQFDRTTLRITDHAAADALLDGPPPRKGWEQYYKV